MLRLTWYTSPAAMYSRRRGGGLGRGGLGGSGAHLVGVASERGLVEMPAGDDVAPAPVVVGHDRVVDGPDQVRRVRRLGLRLRQALDLVLRLVAGRGRARARAGGAISASTASRLASAAPGDPLATGMRNCIRGRNPIEEIHSSPHGSAASMRNERSLRARARKSRHGATSSVSWRVCMEASLIVSVSDLRKRGLVAAA
jgi:hypothetical protein